MKEDCSAQHSILETIKFKEKKEEMTTTTTSHSSQAYNEAFRRDYSL